MPPNLKKRYTIAFYSNPSSLGGSEVYLQNLIAGLDRDNQSFIFFGGDLHPLREWLTAKPSVQFVSLGVHGLTPVDVSSSNSNLSSHLLLDHSRKNTNFLRLMFRRLPASLRLLIGTAKQIVALRHLFREYEFDSIHFNDTGCEPAVVAARLAGIQRITGTYHVSPGQDKASKGLVRRFIEFLSTRALHRAIAVSKTTKNEWLERTGVKSESIEVIYNGIDVNNFPPPRFDRTSFLLENSLDPRFNYVCVPARLHWMKGHKVLFSAIRDYLPKNTELKFILLGDGDLKGELRRYSEDLGISDSIVFVGHASTVGEWMSSSQFIVLPSIALEAFPLALLEAMACEKAVVSTNVGGIPEMIVDGENGFVVPKSDAKALAHAMQKLLSNAKLRETFGQRARERVVNLFTMNESIARTNDFLKQNL